jgi:cell division protease FtsH
MKKWMIFFIISALIITTWLWAINQSSLTLQEDWSVIMKKEKKEEVDLNTFLALYQNNEIERIVVKNNQILQGYWEQVELEDTSRWMSNRFSLPPEVTVPVFTTYLPAQTSIQDLWFSLTWVIPIIVTQDETSLLSRVFLEQIVPLLFFIIILVLAFRMFGPKWGGMPFGIKAWVLRTKTDTDTKFEDVAWMDEVKQELIEIVDYLKKPEKYQKVWARIPKWVLLYGPPGAWKTLLARAVAWEAWVPFFSASGSEFMEMLVWMWAAKVRELFTKAKKSAPSIIFIDEIDTIGKKRWWWYTWWHQEQEQTLNQILTEMDWFEKDNNVIVMAATNRPDTLDSALLRPWRFDRKVYVGRPTLEEREMILIYHTTKNKLDKTVDLKVIARRTSSFVWADLSNIVNEAALKVARENRKALTMKDFDYALEKVIMWPEKKIKTLKEKERNIVAYHELGHAVTAYNLENADPVEKISIVSRWMALWVTWMMPQEDRYLHSKAKFLDELVTLLGWRAAEEIFFWKDEITTWASNDFEKVTKIVYDMLLKYWMDDELWTIVYHDSEKTEYVAFKPYSEAIAQKIDEKVKNIVHTAYQKAKEILLDNKNLIEKMATYILEKEYITKEEFEEMMKDEGAIESYIASLSTNNAN